MEIIKALRKYLLPRGSFREEYGRLIYRFIRKRLLLIFYRSKISDAYANWIKENEAIPQNNEPASEQDNPLNSGPLISIITPVYNPPLDILLEAINSVIAQTYPHWELCIVNGCPENQAVVNLLTDVAKREPRIHVVFLEKNFGISGNSNKALEIAHGEFILLFDHDDTVSQNLLTEVVNLLRKQPDIDLVYFDEDKLEKLFYQRSKPWFKPEKWSPELLLSVNYLMHSVIRLSLIREVGGFDQSMDGAQDWDLAFKITEKSSKIAHIPSILYHWRELPGSTSQAKPYVFSAQSNALTNHLRRTGAVDPSVDLKQSAYHVAWKIKEHKVSIIIPTKDNLGVLKKCLSTLNSKTSYENFEIILVDNHSTGSKTREFYTQLSTQPNIRIEPYNEIFNYSKANNIGAAAANGDLLLFLNNDVEIVSPTWLDELVQWAELPEIGVVGAKLLYPDRTIQHAGVVFANLSLPYHIFYSAQESEYGVFGSPNWYRNYFAVTGACMMLRKDVFIAVGGFDENYLLTFSDSELCFRIAQQGYRVVYNPYAKLIHHEGKSRGNYVPLDDTKRAYSQMGDYFKNGDPYFSPNASLLTRIPDFKQQDEEFKVSVLRKNIFG